MNALLKIGSRTGTARRAPTYRSAPPRATLPFKISLMACILTTAPPSYAEGLGRLFFTPEQRAQLEYSRQKDDNAPVNPRSLTVNGIVQKHGGERTVWINGKPQPAGKSDEHTPESVPVTIPGQSQPIKMKVGQRVLLNPSTPQETVKQPLRESDD